MGFVIWFFFIYILISELSIKRLKSRISFFLQILMPSFQFPIDGQAGGCGEEWGHGKNWNFSAFSIFILHSWNWKAFSPHSWRKYAIYAEKISVSFGCLEILVYPPFVKNLIFFFKIAVINNIPVQNATNTGIMIPHWYHDNKLDQRFILSTHPSSIVNTCLETPWIVKIQGFYHILTRIERGPGAQRCWPQWL